MSGSEIAPEFNPNDPDPVTALPGQPTLTLVPTRMRRGVPCTPSPVKYQRENPATGTVTSTTSGMVPPPVVITSTVPTTSTTCVELAAPINYFPNFNSDQGLCYVDTAKRYTDATIKAVRLTTSGQPAGQGAVWYRAKQRIDAGFETTFQFRVSALFGTGADGLAFVIQNHGANAYNIAGNGGCGIGYQTIRRAFVVEFDTFLNPMGGSCSEIGDPTTTLAAPDMHHIGILGYGNAENLASHSNSGALVNAVQDLPHPTGTATRRGYLEDGVVHTVTIRYVASSHGSSRRGSMVVLTYR